RPYLYVRCLSDTSSQRILLRHAQRSTAPLPYVAPHPPSHSPTNPPQPSLREHVKRHLAPYQQPREIEFVAELPMTTTGKVRRRVLREREAAKAIASGPPKA